MNIIVCVKQVPGTSEVEVDPKTGVLKRDGVKSKMNPYDLYALETALAMKGARGAEVSVITMGPPQAAGVVKEAFMMGVDQGFLLSDRRFAGADVLATSHALSQGIRRAGTFDLIVCGKQTTDGDTAQVGPEIAEFLGVPHVANVRRILELDDKSVTVEMDMPEALEVAKVSFPCLVTMEKDSCQPRLPSFKLKLATQGRAITTFTLDDLADRDPSHYGLDGSPTQVLKIFPPVPNDSHELWEGSGKELATRLADKLKQLKFA